jgi:hypothetical protein
MYTTISFAAAMRLIGASYDHYFTGYQLSVNGQLVDVQLDHNTQTAEICSSDYISLSEIYRCGRCRVVAKYA